MTAQSTAGPSVNPGDAVLEVRNLSVDFALPRATLRAVDNVSLSVYADDVYALVGESGCGKSTAGKAILKLIEPTAGSIRIKGEPIEHLSKAEMRPSPK